MQTPSDSMTTNQSENMETTEISPRELALEEGTSSHLLPSQENLQPSEIDELKSEQPEEKPFLFGLSRYHLMVLISAWLGWSFDIYDGVIFGYAAPVCVPMLLGYSAEQRDDTHVKEAVALWTAILTSILLVGWAVGGIAFGILTDRLGRSRTMMLTIFCYSISTGACAFSFHIAFLAVFRFISALGIGGEWASGSSLIAEALPHDKRVMGGVLMYTAAPAGSLLAYFVTFLLTSSYTSFMPEWLAWRVVFGTAVIPSLLGIVIRFGLKEPESWTEQKESGTILDLFSKDLWWKTVSSFLIVVFALVAWFSVSSFIPVIGIYLAKQYVTRTNSPQSILKRTQDIYITVGVCAYNVGGLIGTFLTYPIAQRLGRVWLFRIYFFCSAICLFMYAVPIPEIGKMVLFFPSGVFLFGIFAAFVFYLPELFPTKVRGTGCGFSYNTGRAITALFPFIAGLLMSRGVSPVHVVIAIGAVPVLGFLFSCLKLVETKNIVL